MEQTIEVSAAWLVGSYVAIVTVTTSGLLWLSRRFHRNEAATSKVGTSLAVLSERVERIGETVSELAARVERSDARVHDAELRVAQLRSSGGRR